MAKEKEFTIADSVHPDYTNAKLDWQKFRYVMEGGDNFIAQYLRSYSAREDIIDFEARKTITPIPSFASAAVTDIKNAIFQRMSEITRQGGSDTYQQVMTGHQGGVDLLGATMSYFVGDKILPELLNLGKVGVYIDMPVIEDTQTLANTKNAHPYLYTYKAEQIKNWRLSKHGEDIQFDMLLLEEQILTYDDLYNLPIKDVKRYRLLTIEDGVVLVKFYNTDGTQINMDGDFVEESIELGIKRIPFVLLELNHSLLQNIANHQIALLNLESSDIGYALLANFPFYIEQQDRLKSSHLKSEESEGEGHREIVAGGTVGRSYGSNINPPAFINPSSEPLRASMEKQKGLKEDIRTLINLSLSTIQPKYASAQAKEFDEHGLESGLSFLGLILEHGERQIASYFTEYENNEKIATINYPERYSLKSDQVRLNEAKDLYEILLKIPSKTAQKVMTRIMIQKLLEAKVSPEELTKILKEIKDAKYITSDPEIIRADIEGGLLSTETGSTARGYDASEEVPKAAAEHAARIKRIKEAQSKDEGARGVDDLSIDEEGAKREKKNSQNADLQGNAAKATRGKNQES